MNWALTTASPTTSATAYSSFSGSEVIGAATRLPDPGGRAAWRQNAFSPGPSGIAILTGSNTTWTATGTLGPAEYTALYNNTASGKNAIGWYSYNASFTLTIGETFTINTSSGVFTVQ